MFSKDYHINRLIKILTDFRHEFFDLDLFYCKNDFIISFCRVDRLRRFKNRELTYRFNANYLNVSQLKNIIKSIQFIIRRIYKGWQFENLKNVVEMKGSIYADIDKIKMGTSNEK